MISQEQNKSEETRESQESRPQEQKIDFSNFFSQREQAQAARAPLGNLERKGSFLGDRRRSFRIWSQQHKAITVLSLGGIIVVSIASAVLLLSGVLGGNKNLPSREEIFQKTPPSAKISP